MNPYRLKNVFEYLTSNNQLLKKKLKLGTSEIPIPPKRDDVTTIEAINRFSKANPRVDTTNLKPLSVKHSKEPDMKADGGRIGYNQGSSLDSAVRTVDPVQDSGNKIEEVLKAYGRYQGNRKGKPMSFSKFFELYSAENFAEGGRAGYEDGGMLVQPSDDGSRPGYNGFKDMNLKRRLDAYQNLKEDYGTEFVEKEFKKKHGTSFEKIASKKEHKGKTVTNIIDGFKKKITGFYKSKNTSPTYNEKTGHIYKTSNRFGTVYSKEPKTNQFTGKELTKNKELIANITEDAPFMSQKELIEKYKINKDTLTKIRDQNNLTFRQSYKPTGTQKKEIPYADRYTAQEKSDMYKKRKATETEEDRINARERKKKYMDKVYKEYKMEPSSRRPFDDLWKDIARSSKEGERIKLIEGPKVYSGASYDDFKTRVFLDTKTGETFNYNNLKQYLDSGKLEGVTYDSVIEPYDLKNQIAKSGLKEEIQQAYFGEKYKPPSRLRSQNTFHVHHLNGVTADPFKVQLTFALDNMGLVHNKDFNREWAKLIKENAPLSERKEYLKFVKSKITDNIAQTLDFPEVGRTRTFGEIGTNMQKLLSNEKFEVIDEKNIKNLIASLGPGTCSVFSGKKADGGRIGLATGTPNIDDCYNAATAAINSGKVPVDKADDFTQLLKRTAGLGRNIMKFGIIPEAMYVAADSLIRVGMGDTFAEAGLRASDYLLPGDQTKTAEISKVSRIFGDETGELVGRTIDYKNQLAKIQSLEDQKANFENLSDGGEFSYIGDLSGDVKNTENLLSQAKNDLDNKFKISEAEQLYAESKQEDAYDASSANSLFTNLKRKYRDSSDNLSDIETLAAPEKTQMQLNLDMLPAVPKDFMMATDDQLTNYVNRESVLSGKKLDPQVYIDEKEKLKKEFMTKGPGVYGKEQVYGTQGTFGGEPVDMTNYQPSNRFAGFKLGMASGGIASLTKTIPPESGPTPQGLPYVYNNVKKIKE